MLKMKDKTRWTMFLLFITVIGFIALSSLLFHLDYNNVLNEKEQYAVYIFDEKALEQTYKNGMVSLDISEITSYTALEKEFYQSIRSRAIILLISLSIAIGLITFLLYFVLKSQNEKNLQDFISEICSVDESSFLHSDTVLSKGYHELEKHFEENLKSFKKLSTYLSHEQKNAIALLRTKLEYHGHREYLKQLDELSNIIEDILTLSDSEDTEMLEETDCILICAETCDKYRKRGYNINFDFNEDDCRILAKPRWIVRAVSNLLDNAVKYGKGHSIELAITRQYDNVIITVTDYGHGIPEQEQSKIFQNHYRVKDLKKDGYGIGLSLVSHICELCGGFVWVESKVDEGSIFYLSFPAFELL